MDTFNAIYESPI